MLFQIHHSPKGTGTQRISAWRKSRDPFGRSNLYMGFDLIWPVAGHLGS